MPASPYGGRQAPAPLAIVSTDWICYKLAMDTRMTMTATAAGRVGTSRPVRATAVARLDEPGSILLHDHTRLPGRFFGRMTASVQAELTG